MPGATLIVRRLTRHPRNAPPEPTARDLLDPLVAPNLHSWPWLAGQGCDDAVLMEQLGLRVTLPPAQWLRDILGPAHTCEWGAMLVRALTKADYDHLVQVVGNWSAGPSAATLTLFFHQLCELAKVVEYELTSGLEFDLDR